MTLEATSATARLDAEVLLAHVLGWSRSPASCALRENASTRPQQCASTHWWSGGNVGEPVAYLTGRREFWSLDLFVTPDTLDSAP